VAGFLGKAYNADGEAIIMRQTAPAAQDLAQRLLALEASVDNLPDVYAASSTFEKLHLSLVKLIGVTGFQALLVRALALAKTEVAWLAAVEVEADGTLRGFEENARKQSAEETIQGEVTLLSQLLGLLITFIGADLTLRLLKQIWSELPSESNLGAEEIS